LTLEVLPADDPVDYTVLFPRLATDVAVADELLSEGIEGVEGFLSFSSLTRRASCYSFN